VAAIAITVGLCAGAQAGMVQTPPAADRGAQAQLDRSLDTTLRKFGFTGRIESSLPARLGRPLDMKLAEVGRRLFFDPITGLHDDNTCAGCHAPNAAFGDTQSIAIGIQNNRIVGPGRKGPRNQRRTPSVLNTAFFPKLMWNARFSAPSGDPFDNSRGFSFPLPEGTTKFPANDPQMRHLLIAQAHLPVTELNEAAGFTGTRGAIDPRFDQFDDGLGSKLPAPDASGFRNEPIRQAVVKRLNATPAYVSLFGTAFPEVRQGAPISEVMFARAIAEFEFTLVRANAPVDRFARGQIDAMDASEKRGALLFFGKANCVTCHAVTGSANEMFSDFTNRVAAVPQIAPRFGAGLGDTIFDGPGEDEDFGMEQISGNAADRYKFRTAPLRNAGLQPAFFHNGAFTRLDDAIRYHLDAAASAPHYSPGAAGVAPDIYRMGPMEGPLQRLDPELTHPPKLSEQEIGDLVRFVGVSLTDPRARSMCNQIPASLPSGRTPLTFQNCGSR
jgi:cytochrome c peroxidase